MSNESRERVEEIVRENLVQKLKDLDMGEGDWARYEDLRKRVDLPIRQLRVLLKDIKRRREERVWLRRQSTGELDDSRLVDAIAGEKDVFKRRGKPTVNTSNSNQETEPMAVRLVVDVCLDVLIQRVRRPIEPPPRSHLHDHGSVPRRAARQGRV